MSVNQLNAQIKITELWKAPKSWLKYTTIETETGRERTYKNKKSYKKRVRERERDMKRTYIKLKNYNCIEIKKKINIEGER